MENKNVGYLIVGISAIIWIIIFIFNKSLKNIVDQTCSHGSGCTMYTTISLQTWFSAAISGIILIIGLFLIFAKENEKIVIQKVKEKERRKRLNLDGLDNDELTVVKLLKKEKGMFQADLMEKLNIGKVKTTRLLDKLEAKQLVERKRRGMNNFVVLND